MSNDGWNILDDEFLHWQYIRTWWAYYVGMMVDCFPMGMNLHIWLDLDKEIIER